MSEYIINNPIMLASILANFIGLWALLKAFRAQGKLKKQSERLTKHRQMIGDCSHIATSAYTQTKVLEEALRVIATSSYQDADHSHEAATAEPDNDEMEEDSHESNVSNLEEARYVTKPVNQQEARPRP